ncbi:MAG: hypothetical protein QME52_13120 [Bacteroidota bacterium]|nr:hypothetical protein [Bacteroidota bacterium]
MKTKRVKTIYGFTHRKLVYNSSLRNGIFVAHIRQRLLKQINRAIT